VPSVLVCPSLFERVALPVSVCPPLFEWVVLPVLHSPIALRIAFLPIRCRERSRVALKVYQAILQARNPTIRIK